jgi:serine phosphatase RsbU (regulator of sigma subunit)
LVLRSDGTVERVGEHGPLLGILSPAQSYPAVHLELEAGDSVMMYTDGLIERNPRLPTEDNLRAVLASLVGLSAEEAIRRLEASSIAAGSSPARDDIAVLILRVAPQPGWSSGSRRAPRTVAVV